MTDHIDKLTRSHADALYAALIKATDKTRAGIDMQILTAVISHAEEKRVTAHDLEQLSIALGFSLDEMEPLFDALDERDPDAFVPLLGSLFAAVAASAAATYKFTINANATRTTSNALARDIIHDFTQTSATAVRESIGRTIRGAKGDYASRANQIRRVIGLTPALASSVDYMRDVLYTYLDAPQRVETRPGAKPRIVRTIDPERLIRSARAGLTAPQRNMLRKAMASGLTPQEAERILDRHADALTKHRARVTAQHQADTMAEHGKLAGWQAAQQAGFLPPTTRRIWETAKDERVRHSHAAVPNMNPAGVALDQPFKTPFGDRMVPPLEINCRCRARLKIPS